MPPLTSPPDRKPRAITIPVMIVVVAFWLLAGLADMATLYFDPDVVSDSISWHAWFKRAAFAVFWIGVTLLALAWYRERPVNAATWRRHLATTGLAATVLTAAYAAYFGLLLLFLSGGQLPWTDAIRRIGSLELLYIHFKLWQIAVAVIAYYHYRGLVERERERERLQLRLTELQLLMFRAQLEPHFLFNTLNTIASLVRLERNAEAINALNRLGALLRGMLEVGARQLMPWRWELSFARTYVALQTLRFADKLEVRFATDGIADDAPFPVMLLQPLIENAIQHGPLGDGEPCTIEVEVAAAPGGWRVRVTNAIGRACVHESHGVGLDNAAARLRAIYGAAARFECGGADGVYVATALIPARADAGAQA